MSGAAQGASATPHSAPFKAEADALLPEAPWIEVFQRLECCRRCDASWIGSVRYHFRGRQDACRYGSGHSSFVLFNPPGHC